MLENVGEVETKREISFQLLPNTPMYFRTKKDSSDSSALVSRDSLGRETAETDRLLLSL